MTISNQSQGVFTADDLQVAINAEQITLGAPLLPTQVQPASLDLTLGATAWRVRAAFLPGVDASVEARLEGGLGLHKLDLRDGAVLEKGCVYVVRLREGLNLPAIVRARANPKSSTGRVDVFVRLVTDRGEAYEAVPQGYCGPLYAEISPRTFSILLREGSSLNQLRLRQGFNIISDADLRERHQLDGLVNAPDCRIEGGLRLSVDLGASLGDVVGYRARRHSGLIDMDRVGSLDPAEFWEPIAPPKGGSLILDPEEFYILASREELCIPHDWAAEMMSIDPDLGSFRVHYAGFFDPGFGVGVGSRAVLEVRGYDAPFLVEHGQTMARLIYEPLLRAPKTVYGAGLKSNYQGQALRLSKHFKTA